MCFWCANVGGSATVADFHSVLSVFIRSFKPVVSDTRFVKKTPWAV